MNRKLTGFLVTFLALSPGFMKLRAQSTATAGANAIVVAPITVVKNVDMNFGNIAVSVTSGGSVVLAPGGLRTTLGTGVTLPAAAGTVAAASFTVSGNSSYTYAITLPGSATISDGGGHSMSVSGFTSNPSSTGSLGTGGTQTVTVGATLSVSATQTPGNYTNSSGVPVTVNYN